MDRPQGNEDHRQERPRPSRPGQDGLSMYPDRGGYNNHPYTFNSEINLARRDSDMAQVPQYAQQPGPIEDSRARMPPRREMSEGTNGNGNASIKEDPRITWSRDDHSRPMSQHARPQSGGNPGNTAHRNPAQPTRRRWIRGPTTISRIPRADPNVPPPREIDSFNEAPIRDFNGHIIGPPTGNSNSHPNGLPTRNFNGHPSGFSSGLPTGHPNSGRTVAEINPRGPHAIQNPIGNMDGEQAYQNTRQQFSHQVPRPPTFLPPNIPIPPARQSPANIRRGRARSDSEDDDEDDDEEPQRRRRRSSRPPNERNTRLCASGSDESHRPSLGQGFTEAAYTSARDHDRGLGYRTMWPTEFPSRSPLQPPNNPWGAAYEHMSFRAPFHQNHEGRPPPVPYTQSNHISQPVRRSNGFPGSTMGHRPMSGVIYPFTAPRMPSPQAPGAVLPIPIDRRVRTPPSRSPGAVASIEPPAPLNLPDVGTERGLGIRYGSMGVALPRMTSEFSSRHTSVSGYGEHTVDARIGPSEPPPVAMIHLPEFISATEYESPSGGNRNESPQRGSSEGWNERSDASDESDGAVSSERSNVEADEEEGPSRTSQESPGLSAGTSGRQSVHLSGENDPTQRDISSEVSLPRITPGIPSDPVELNASSVPVTPSVRSTPSNQNAPSMQNSPSVRHDRSGARNPSPATAFSRGGALNGDGHSEVESTNGATGRENSVGRQSTGVGDSTGRGITVGGDGTGDEHVSNGMPVRESSPDQANSNVRDASVPLDTINEEDPINGDDHNDADTTEEATRSANGET